MKLLWIENAYPVNSRSQRIIDTIVNLGEFEVHVCAWDRSGNHSVQVYPPDYHVLRTRTGYKRLGAKTLALPMFFRHIAATASNVNPSVVISSFWDACLGTTLTGAAENRIHLYDVIDLPGGSGLFYRTGRCLERMSLSGTDGIILASRFYKQLYPKSIPSLIAENLPTSRNHKQISIRTAIVRPRIAYVGTIRFPESLIPFLSVASKQGIQVDLYGGGPDLEMLRSQFGSDAIRFHGPYKYSELDAIYSNVDILWAAYPVSDYNVRYAISNKYHESLAYAIPGVFTDNTELGSLVKQEGTGFVLDPTSESDISRWLMRLETDSHYQDVLHRLIAKRQNQSDALFWNANSAAIANFIYSLLPGGRP